MSNLAGWSEAIKRIGDESRLQELANAELLRKNMPKMLEEDRKAFPDALLDTYNWAHSGSYGMDPVSKVKAEYAKALRAIIIERMKQ